MLYLKFFGCLLVMASCTLAGYSMKFKIQYRLIELENLMSCIQIFENEIRYNINDVINSVKKILDVAADSNRNLFLKLLEKSKDESGSPLSQIWKGSVSEALAVSCYDKEDIKTIMEFGNILGSGDVDTQLKNLDMFKKNIENRIAQCKQKSQKNSLVYSKTGIYSGIMIIILLI